LNSLSLTGANLDDAELADLTSLESLELLSIDERFLTRQSHESLLALKWLKTLRLAQDNSLEESDQTVTIALDDGKTLRVRETDADVFRRALETLRQSNPGIVVKKEPWRDDTFVSEPPFPHEGDDLHSSWLPANSNLSPSSIMRSFLEFPPIAPPHARHESESEGE
jgi:hypothetical protein